MLRGAYSSLNFLMGILGVMIVKKYNENKSLPFSIERLTKIQRSSR